MGKWSAGAAMGLGKPRRPREPSNPLRLVITIPAECGWTGVSLAGEATGKGKPHPRKARSNPSAQGACTPAECGRMGGWFAGGIMDMGRLRRRSDVPAREPISKDTGGSWYLPTFHQVNQIVEQ